MKVLGDSRDYGAIVETGIRKLILATDLEQHSELTLQYAEALARLFKARMLLFHVVDPAFFWVFPLQGMPAEPAHINEEITSRLCNVASALREKGIDCEAIVHQGAVRSEIKSMIFEKGADLLIVGAHPPESLRQLAFGSTWNSLIHQVACPVITIGPNALPLSGRDPYRLDRIVLATDFSSASRAATAYAVALAKANRSRLSVAHVRTYEERICNEQRLKFSLHELVPELKNEDFGAVVLDGDPVGVLSNYARKEHADLIVMGIKQASRAATVLSHGIAYEVICYAKCPVFTIAQKKVVHADRPAFFEEIAETLV